ncbi:MAG: hypothetical protein AAB778_00200 [Patescibacteria group bacterium]
MKECSALIPPSDNTRRGLGYSKIGKESVVDISLVHSFGPLLKNEIINEAAYSLGLTYDDVVAKLEQGETVKWVPKKTI